MSLTDLFGNGAALRAPSGQNMAIAARSGAEKASAMQSPATVRPGAPVETIDAVAQPEAGTRARMDPGPPPASRTDNGASLPVPPMTAVLLHELRLQQELADVQAAKEQTPGA